MAWIEVHQALRDHRKVLQLADELGLIEQYVVGHLIYLWLWSLDNAPDGILPSDRIIEKAAGWPGERGRFVEACLKVGLFDIADDGTRTIHDWDDYVGKLIDQRKANADRQRRHREKMSQSPPRNSDVTVTSPLRNGATVPYRTLPNTTEPSLSPRVGARAREDTRTMGATAPERESSSSLGEEDETRLAREEKQRKSQIRTAIVEAWGQPDEAARSKWNAGIQQIADSNHTLEDIRLALKTYPQRRPKGACNPVALAREIGALLTEARASPSLGQPVPMAPRRSFQPTEEEIAESYAQIARALGE